MLIISLKETDAKICMALYKEYEKLPQRPPPPKLTLRKPLFPLMGFDENTQNFSDEHVKMEVLDQKALCNQDLSSAQVIEEPVSLKGVDLKSFIDDYVKQALKKELRNLCTKFESVIEQTFSQD